jgi:hypothetical protein
VPVLDDAVDRDVVVPVVVLDPEIFRLGRVAVFRLDQAVTPFREKRRMAGRGPVPGDDLVDLRAVEKVVIQNVAAFGGEIIPGIGGEIPVKIGP